VLATLSSILKSIKNINNRFVQHMGDTELIKRAVLLSLLLLLMSTFAKPDSTVGMLSVSNPTNMEQMSILSNETIWHHDCSNVSGWVIDPSPPQIRLNGIQSDVDILSDGSAINSSSIPFALGRWHGSVFFYELETPVFVGHGLNFEVELDHPGTSSRAGGIEVGLYDQNKNISYWVSIIDSWYASSFSTDLAYGDGGTNYIHTTSRSGSLVSDYRIWHDEVTDTILGKDNQGTYPLANSGEFEHDREIHYVGIMFWNVEDYDYESNLVLDILIEGTSVESITSTSSTTSINDMPVNLTLVITISSVGVIIIVVILLMKSRGPSSGGGLQGYQW
jgi:hypothetical protein